MSDFATPWTVAYQAPLSMEFSRQVYWSGLPFPPAGDLPDPGIEPIPLASPALSGGFFTTEPPGSLFCQSASLSQTTNEKQIEPFIILRGVAIVEPVD